MFVVLLRSNGEVHAYGPFPDMRRANGFREFLTAEVDPAAVVPLTSPADELTAWYEAQKARSRNA
jgi:hypothetical protein